MEIPKFKVCSDISFPFYTGIVILHLITYFFCCRDLASFSRYKLYM